MICLKNIEITFFFSKICEKMETKILKYWKTIPPLFSLAACMDPRVKVEGVENILNYIACYMNQPHEPEGHIYEQLNSLYKYYKNKYDSAVENFRKRFNNLDPNRTIKSTNLTIVA